MHFRNDTQISIVISTEIYFIQCTGGMIREIMFILLLYA